jgi:homoserine dehydrogenase
VVQCHPKRKREKAVLMNNQKKLTIGLFGFGVVGEGIYQVLQQTPSLNATIKKICIKNPDKKRNCDPALLTTNYGDILNDPEINVVVELINDAEEAHIIVSTALRKKKAVVSANKKMIADNLKGLLDLQQNYNAALLYEAAVCGSIPIIRNLEEYFDNDLLQSICGIVNGSTNYILTKVLDDKLEYKAALLQAQMNGFAETDPSLDVEGMDAMNKLTILLLHAYGIIIKPNQLLCVGIDRIHTYDARFADERDLQIKLTAQARKISGGKIAAFVLPQFVTPESQLYGVKNEYNGVVLQSSFSDKQFLYGKGAGRFPTASAVLSDISALRFDYRYEYRKYGMATGVPVCNDYYFNLYVSFDSLADVDLKDFEWIEEFYCHENRHFVIGTISYLKLFRAEWLKNKSVSVIVCPDGVIDNMQSKEIRKMSLELAGVKFSDRVLESISRIEV